jgi:hypothetical protein
MSGINFVRKGDYGDDMLAEIGISVIAGRRAIIYCIEKIDSATGCHIEALEVRALGLQPLLVTTSRKAGNKRFVETQTAGVKCSFAAPLTHPRLRFAGRRLSENRVSPLRLILNSSQSSEYKSVIKYSRGL